MTGTISYFVCKVYIHAKIVISTVCLDIKDAHLSHWGYEVDDSCMLK